MTAGKQDLGQDVGRDIGQDMGQDMGQDRGSRGTAAPEGAARNFRRRVASALVLAPVALVCTYAGGILFLLVCLVASAAILWEWIALVLDHRRDLRYFGPGLATLLLAATAVGRGQPSQAIAALAIGTVLTGIAAIVFSSASVALNVALWAAGGVIYAGVVLMCPVLLRDDPVYGLAAMLFLFATVWATDIFAYLTGRTLGGPLLWPKLSPNKTWSGAIGGLIGGVAAGIAVAYASGGPRGAVAGVLALVLSVVAQGGDLFESAIKRRFGVKDTSHLIPGHGGVMDRLDGFLVAALAAVLIGILRQGVAAPARGLLAW
jgi:phosphatidate cytidylyltransferase